MTKPKELDAVGLQTFVHSLPEHLKKEIRLGPDKWRFHSVLAAFEEVRHEKHMNQNNFCARLFGIHGNTYRQWLYAKRPPQRANSTLGAIMLVFQMHLDQRSRDELLANDIRRTKTSNVPIYATVQCGHFTWSESFEEYPDEYVTVLIEEYHLGMFGLIAAGDSMADRILPGDRLIFDSKMKAKNGATVCAMLTGDSDGCTIKRYQETKTEITLLPNNPEHDKIELKKNGDGLTYNGKRVQLLIKGVLTQTIRRET